MNRGHGKGRAAWVLAAMALLGCGSGAATNKAATNKAATDEPRAAAPSASVVASSVVAPAEPSPSTDAYCRAADKAARLVEDAAARAHDKLARGETVGKPEARRVLDDLDLRNGPRLIGLELAQEGIDQHMDMDQFKAFISIPKERSPDDPCFVAFATRVKAASGDRAALEPLATVKDPFVWRTDGNAALAEARKEKRGVVLLFCAEWVPACEDVRTSFVDGEVAKAIVDRFVPVLVSDSEDPIVQQYKVKGFPLAIVLDPAGHPSHRLDSKALDPASIRAALR